MNEHQGEIRRFQDAAGRIDTNAWHHDIAAVFLGEHVGVANSTTTDELYEFYFGRGRQLIEWKLMLEHGIQVARQILEHGEIPVILRNLHFRWFCVPADDTAGARGFMAERAKRVASAVVRLQNTSDILQTTYALDPGDPLARAVDRLSPGIRRITRALPPPPGLEDHP